MLLFILCCNSIFLFAVVKFYSPDLTGTALFSGDSLTVCSSFSSASHSLYFVSSVILRASSVSRIASRSLTMVYRSKSSDGAEHLFHTISARNTLYSVSLVILRTSFVSRIASKSLAMVFRSKSSDGTEHLFQAISVRNTQNERYFPNPDLRALILPLQDMYVDATVLVEKQIVSMVASLQYATNRSLEDWLFIVKNIGGDWLWGYPFFTYALSLFLSTGSGTMCIRGSTS